MPLPTIVGIAKYSYNSGTAYRFLDQGYLPLVSTKRNDPRFRGVKTTVFEILSLQNFPNCGPHQNPMYN
jgi:hypothetical protein